MHLKTLSLKGFKSFASATTLHLEPGITCVVGPNGSGKSNVVDALAWVMGEQGARSLRGASMQDVIFAGTAATPSGPGRPPLGRAEVSLTIDNADGALPFAAPEVTITRTMFRAGGSEYAINGTPARLLDVTELLSDTGIGREMHVIVGQGQLDAVLHATPEERRGFIEEAAGVLKHRRRKEKALRKLDAMQANLVRLTDLAAEVRRQLGPLARQADAARRAQTVQAEVRDARSRLLAHDLAQAQSALEADLADEAASVELRADLEQRLAAARTALAAAEAAEQSAAARLAPAAEACHALVTQREGLRGTAALAAERERTLAAAAQASGVPGGRDPDELDAAAERAREAEQALTAQVVAAREALQRAAAAARAAEAEQGAHERSVAAAARAAADRRERRARLEARVAAARGALEAAVAEAARAEQQLVAARGREGEAAAALAQAVGEPSDAQDDDGGAAASTRSVDQAAAAASGALADAEQRLTAARAAERAAERDRAGAAARLEALELGLADRRDGAGALVAAGARLPGVLGAVAGLLHVEPGAEDVVTAALGDLAEAVVVESLDAAVDALRLLRHEAAGRADLVVLPGARAAAERAPSAGGRRAAHAAGGAIGDATAELRAILRGLDGVDSARPVASLVTADGELGRAVAELLAAHVAVPGLAQARALVAARPCLVAVTEAGDVLRATSARGGGAGGTSRVHVQAAADAAREALAEAQTASTAASQELREATELVTAARDRRDAALAELAARDAAAAREARRTGELTAAARAAAADAARAAQQHERARAAVVVADQKAAALAAELASDADEPGPSSMGEHDDDATRSARRSSELATAATAARGAEVEARLALRTAEERERASSGRAEGLARAARQERAARERAAEQARRHRAGQAVAAAVLAGAQASLEVLERVLAAAGRVREEAGEQRDGAAAAVLEGRRAVEVLISELAALTDAAHREEVARVEQRAVLDALRARAADELGLDPEVLLAEFAPGEDFDRPEQEARLAKAEKSLARLGRVNPLALEEYAALEERSAFLTAQLDDLRTTRADLLEIVKTVDERVQQAFAEAFADTAAAFDRIFPRLFPGGEGRLVLTDPSDLLTTGVEVEARPAGKRVKRLSLLSGGERSLTAVGLLVAIFTARPSPFYVLDEVEAALDDANLRRLLAVLEELRASSQLIVITHQERTMEIADALYGVTMRSDGVTAVVSQRLRERAATGS
ncbi:condensin subunit Smc [Quadrisphaera granulorum]|uniref:Chromosome partition protein Smc n=1 Tax=Quadrisphaera granulorum TaxID=317664 RepID=A0A316AF24_9ACTN|nr:chromosome segregation protein SMC [Quadrisphaera granulorum]PWJ56386.1 condensin subunit Smc [Quadrisphaera granulorum]SZE95020.1 condensin subunit Smc [Quadrisphaera granulorum]